MATVEILDPQARFFTSKSIALHVHYHEGGTMWRRADGVDSCVKPWANGNISDGARQFYVPYMVNGGAALEIPACS